MLSNCLKQDKSEDEEQSEQESPLTTHSDVLIVYSLFGALHGLSAEPYLWVNRVTVYVYLCTRQQLHDTKEKIT